MSISERGTWALMVDPPLGSMPCTRPRLPFRFPIMSPALFSGTLNFDVHNRLEQAGFGLFHALLESLRAGELKSHFRRIHFVVGTVEEDDAEIHHGTAGQIPFRGCLDDALLDGRDEVPGDGAAEDVVHKLEARPALQGFQLDPAVAVLAVTAGLFLVLALRFGLGANRLAIGNLGRFQSDFDIESPLELRNSHFHVLLARAGEQEFLGLCGSREKRRSRSSSSMRWMAVRACLHRRATSVQWQTRWRVPPASALGIRSARPCRRGCRPSSVSLSLATVAEVTSMEFGHWGLGFALHYSDVRQTLAGVLD